VIGVAVGATLARQGSTDHTRSARPAASTPAPAKQAPPRASTSTTTAVPAISLPTRAAVARPPIVWPPIPFGAIRRAETVAYDERHYGLNSWRLTNPKVIVEHYTGSTTFSSTYATFSNDQPDAELHELPGICAHFVVDTDGTIYQLVSLNTICRHTVGLNWTAIGIEHVGTSDRQILDNPRQLEASLKLTLWLMQRFHIRVANVIGHNESLTSPYHHELYPSWRCQTHSDWTRADMDLYRADLLRLAQRHHLNLGHPRHRASQC
jgi:N-acetylmuramoyl-L-alanine amidase